MDQPDPPLGSTARPAVLAAVGAGALAAAAGIGVFILLRGAAGVLAGGLLFAALGLGASYGLARRRRPGPIQSVQGVKEGAQVSPELLGILSHEVRTPLNGILGMTKLLLGLRPTAEQREYLEMLKSSGESILRLVNDLLDYSSFEAGKLRLESEEFHLRRFLRQTVKTLSPQAHMKGLELAYWVEPEVPEVVRGDPGRLRQVIANLIVNAIKFTENGEILVEAALAAAGSDRPRVCFSVKDTGVGIPEAFRRRIFEAFAQGPAASAQAQGGLGLGLAISSRLAERMEGTLSVTSEEGRGSTFYFDLPFEVVATAEAAAEGRPPEAFQGARVLVVDDSPMQRRILTARLGEWGSEVEAVADGETALAAVERSLQQGRPFSLLLLDSSLDGADSLRLAERIQERSRIPGILMTLAHEYVDPEALRRHGFLGHLSKPIAPSHLSRAIEIIRRGATVDKPEDVQTLSMDRLLLAGLRVLLAEDHPVNRAVVARSLQNAGSEVVATEDGAEALELLWKEHFDVLLLDLEMPVVGGLDVAREIRKREAGGGRRLPIVAITAHSRHEDRERCLEAGMDAFLVKPFDEAALLDVLGPLLVPRRSERRKSPAPPSTKLEVVSRSEVFDYARALARANGDQALVIELCGLFVEEAPQTVVAIARALAAGDFGAVERKAHRLKGALLTLSAHRAAEAALDLEMVAKAGEAAGCRTAFERLEVELGALEGKLSSILDVETR